MKQKENLWLALLFMVQTDCILHAFFFLLYFTLCRLWYRRFTSIYSLSAIVHCKWITMKAKFVHLQPVNILLVSAMGPALR